jgi:hypothetical protein
MPKERNKELEKLVNLGFPKRFLGVDIKEFDNLLAVVENCLEARKGVFIQGDSVLECSKALSSVAKHIFLKTKEPLLYKFGDEIPDLEKCRWDFDEAYEELIRIPYLYIDNLVIRNDFDFKALESLIKRRFYQDKVTCVSSVDVDYYDCPEVVRESCVFVRLKNTK